MRAIVGSILAVAFTLGTVWLFLPFQLVKDVIPAIANADFALLFVAGALIAGVQWVRAWRLSIFSTGQATLPDMDFVSVAAQLNFYSFLVPYRMGDLSYPVLAKKVLGHPIAKAAAVLLATRLLDLAAVTSLFLGIGAILGAFGGPAGQLALAAATGLLIAPVAGVPFIAIFMRAVNRKARLASLARALEHCAEFRSFLPVYLLGYAIWIQFALAAFLCARAADLQIGAVTAGFGSTASNIAFALPISGIAGLGPSQAAWVLALQSVGVDVYAALVSALAFYLVTLASACVCGLAGFALMLARAPRT